MALISYTRGDDGPDYKVLVWSGATTADTFQPVRLDRRPWAIYVQAEDSDGWSASASLALHGSVDGVTYYALQDYSQTDLALTANGLVSLGEAPPYIKPVLTAGDSDTDITVQMHVWFQGR